MAAATSAGATSLRPVLLHEPHQPSALSGIRRADDSAWPGLPPGRVSARGEVAGASLPRDPVAGLTIYGHLTIRRQVSRAATSTHAEMETVFGVLLPRRLAALEDRRRARGFPCSAVGSPRRSKTAGEALSSRACPHRPSLQRRAACTAAKPDGQLYRHCRLRNPRHSLVACHPCGGCLTALARQWPNIRLVTAVPANRA